MAETTAREDSLGYRSPWRRSRERVLACSVALVVFWGLARSMDRLVFEVHVESDCRWSGFDNI